MRTNEELLAEANSIEFKFTKSGNVNYFQHTKYELGLYFIKNAIEQHGNKYQYGLVKYNTKATKVTLICPRHGEFDITPAANSKGGGCKKCHFEDRTLSTEDFISRAKQVHGDFYDYSTCKYINANEKVLIHCRLHGDFSQLPFNHLKGQRCPVCGNNAKKNSLEQFIEKANQVHSGKYSYDKAVYVNTTTPILIKCDVHGYFYQTPDHHTNGKCGCPQCYLENKVLDTKSFIERASIIHNNTYDYSNVVYTTTNVKVSIRCKEHGEFLQEPRNHLKGKGCPRCGHQNHNILYLLKCKNTNLHKIGVTTNDVQKRISSIGGELVEIFHVVCDDPMTYEKLLHTKYQDINIYNDTVRNGNTEFFSLTEEQVKEVINYMKELK